LITDGRRFHLSAFQLNTLNLDGGKGVKNIFWHHKEIVDLYDKCKMERALPIFDGLDMDVFSKLKAIYLL